MSYYVDVGIITDKKGFDTLIALPAIKELYEKGESSYSEISTDDEGKLYYISIDQVNDSYLINNGVFIMLNSLERVETLTIGEEYNDIRHVNKWPESMNDNPPLDYLYCNRIIELSSNAKKIKEV